MPNDLEFEKYFFEGKVKPKVSDAAMDGYLARMAKDILDGKKTSDVKGPTVREYAVKEAGASRRTRLAVRVAGVPIHEWDSKHATGDPKDNFYIKFIQMIKDKYGGEGSLAKKVMKPLDHALKLKYLQIQLGDVGFKEVQQAYDSQKPNDPKDKIKDVLVFAETKFPVITSKKELVSGFEKVNNRFKEAFKDVKNLKTQPDVFTVSTEGDNTDKESVSSTFSEKSNNTVSSLDEKYVSTPSSKEPKEVTGRKRHGFAGSATYHKKRPEPKPPTKSTLFSRIKDFLNKSLKFLGNIVGKDKKVGPDISKDFTVGHNVKPVDPSGMSRGSNAAKAAQKPSNTAKVAPDLQNDSRGPSKGPKGP